MSSVSSTSCLTARADRRQARGDEVGQPARLGDVHRQRLQIVGQQRRQRDDLLEVRLDVARQRVDLEPIGVVGALGRRGRRARARRAASTTTPRARSRARPWTISRRLPSGSLNILWMCVAVPTRIEIVLARLLDARVALGEDGDQLAVGDRIVDQPHGALARHRERHERVGKQDRVPKRQNRQLRRNRERPIADRDVLGLEVLDLIAHSDLDSMKRRVTRRGHCVDVERERPVGRTRGSATGGAPRRDAGSYMSRNSEAVPRRAAICRWRCSATLARLLAVLAADREGQRPEPLLGDLFAALEAVAVVALFEPRQRVVDLVQRLRLHLDQRELDVVLDVGFRALDRVEHLVQLAAPGALGAHVAHLTLHFGLDFTTTVFEHPLQFGITGPVRCCPVPAFIVASHDAAPSSPRRAGCRR